MRRNQIKRLDIGFCSLCGRAAFWSENAKKLQDDAIICGECVRKLRVMYPFPLDPKDIKHDPLKNLTTGQARDAMGKVTEFIEDFRERYGYRNAVFIVNKIEKEGGGLFKSPLYCLYGRVLYGGFSINEDVTVKHGQSLYQCRLKDVYLDVPLTDGYALREKDHAEGGYPAILQIQERNLDIQVRDLIVK
ncbi:MAG: hypothetical protein IKI30_03460 [Oxalobacter sp.]|nr:hypothetical protein [Oxalobacter sp.]